MKTFKGPIDGFNNNHDDDIVSDSDEEGNIGQELFDFGSDEEHEFQVIGPNVYLGDAANASSDEEVEDADAEEEVEAEQGGDVTSDEGEMEASDEGGDDESLPDPELEQEHVHDASCSGSSPVLAPSPGPEVEVESDLTSSPVVDLHRVYGELDIARRLEAEAAGRLSNPDSASRNRNEPQKNGDDATSRSSSELSELSEPEEPELLKVNGTLTPTPATPRTPGTLNRSEGYESPRVLVSADVTEDEGEGDSSTVYSNPMISAEDEADSNVNGSSSVNPEAGDGDEKLIQLRGDCIGSTTYSERHVLKILIKWMKQVEVMREQNQNQEEKQELETEFDNELSFLWDMSSEKDVALYLSEKDIFTLLRESLTMAECDRLVEIAIGILVNLLSVPEILKTFPDVETKLQFLPPILSELVLCRRIPRLVQSLAFLRRLVWYMSTAEVVEAWMGPLTEVEFIQAVNFLLKSCRNIGILSELVTILFMLLEIIRDSHILLTRAKMEPVNEGVNEEEASGSSSDEDEAGSKDGGYQTREKESIGKQNKRIVYEFCKHGLIISLCESLQELLKYPVIDAELWPKSTTAGRGDTNEDGLQVIPPNAIQESICLGLNTFEFIHKIKSCREFLYEDAGIIINIYIEFYHRFHLYTQHVSNDAALDHFAEGLKLVGYYQSKLPSLVSRAVILKPLAAARKFKQQQEACKRQKQTESDDEPASEPQDASVNVSDDLVTSIAVIVHEYLAQLGEKFQLEKIHKIVLDEKNEKFSRFLEFVNAAVQNVHQRCLQSTTVNSSGREGEVETDAPKVNDLPISEPTTVA